MTRISSKRLDMENGRIDQAVLKSYGETVFGGSAGINTGSIFLIELEAGRVNHAASFVGTNHLMTLDSAITLGSNPYTIATWFRYPQPSTGGWNTLTRGATGDHQVIVRQSDFQLGIYDNGGTDFNGSGFFMNTLSAGWHHLVAIGSGSTTEFYIDGVSIGSAGYKSDTEITYVGNYQGFGQQFGTIDELRIYNRALSPAEIAALYGDASVSNTDLAGQWNFDEGSGSVTADSSVNGNDGTLSGGAYWAGGNVFNLILTANCTFTFSNPTASGTACSFTLLLKQDWTGSRTATWPASVVWPGAVAPTLTTTPTRTDVLNFFTINGGTSWAGSIGGQNFATWGVPDVPTSLVATAGDTEVDLAWSAPASDGGSAITNYKIYRDTASPATTLIDTIGVTTSYNDTGRTNGTEYFYRVKATNALGDSDYSNEDSAVPALQMAFQASASSNAATITIPADSAVGDLAVLFDRARNSSGVPTDVIPTNWTGLVTASDSNVRRIRCSYKVLVSGDPGASITGINGSADDRKQMVVFRPSSGITTVTPSTWLAQMTDGNPASQAVSASGQAVPLVVLGYTNSDNNSAFSTASPAFDATITHGSGTAYGIVGYKIYNSAPANHTIDMNDLGVGNSLSSGYLIVS